MFTGLIEEIGRVQSIVKSSKSARITIRADLIPEEVETGDSISTNGVCLTVVNHTRNCFSADVMAETLRRSNLSLLCSGDKVNLERAVKVGERLGGHIVSGHIDGIGSIVGFDKEEIAGRITIVTEKEILKFIVQKGSVAVDGISLTVAFVDKSKFMVSIIPHTKEITTLLEKRVGDIVNLECDILGKYVEKILSSEKQAAVCGSIDRNFLREYGYDC